MFSHCCFSVVCHHACLSLFLKYCIHMEEQYQEERDKQHHPTSWHPYSPCRPYGWYGLRQLLGRQWSMGVIFFIADMFLMFLGSSICHLLPPPPPSREVRQIRGTLAELLGPSPLIPLNSPQTWSRHNPHSSPSTAHRHGRGTISTHPPQQPTGMGRSQSPARL